MSSRFERAPYVIQGRYTVPAAFFDLGKHAHTQAWLYNPVDAEQGFDPWTEVGGFDRVKPLKGGKGMIALVGTYGDRALSHDDLVYIGPGAFLALRDDVLGAITDARAALQVYGAQAHVIPAQEAWERSLLMSAWQQFLANNFSRIKA